MGKALRRTTGIRVWSPTGQPVPSICSVLPARDTAGDLNTLDCTQLDEFCWFGLVLLFFNSMVLVEYCLFVTFHWLVGSGVK